MKRPRAAAFTLVELMVVVAVVALLIAILLPSISSARAQAHKVVCQSRLRQIANALWSYTVANDGRVPYIISPMTNGGATGEDGQPVPGFGHGGSTDEMLDPFDAQRWPESLPNVLFRRELQPSPLLFVCPAAIRGYPRDGRAYTMTFRPASANQINGAVIPVEEGSPNYLREHFGFLDGRKLKDVVMSTERPVTAMDYVRQEQERLYQTATYLRDLVRIDGDEIIGPHGGGINVINRRVEIEYRDQRLIQEQLKANGVAVQF